MSRVERVSVATMESAPFARVKRGEFVLVDAGPGCMVTAHGSGHISMVGQPAFNIFVRWDDDGDSVVLFNCPLGCLGIWDESRW